MTEEEMDMFLRRAVLAAAGMMKEGAGFNEMIAFHYAIGLALMGASSGNGIPIAQITKNGLDTLHATAHSLAEETDFDLLSYANRDVANMHLAADLGVILQGGELMNWGYMLLIVFGGPLVICTIWEIVDYLNYKAAEPPTCDCGRHFLLPDGDCVDARGTVHGLTLCQPGMEAL